MAAVVSLVVRAIENVLYPVVVKDRLKVPSLCIFVALVGGVLLFWLERTCAGAGHRHGDERSVRGICVRRMAEPAFGLGAPDRPRREPVKSTDDEQTSLQRR